MHVVNVTYRNISGRVQKGGEFFCSEYGPPTCRSIVLQDVNLSIATGGDGCHFHGVAGNSRGHILPESCAL